MDDSVNDNMDDNIDNNMGDNIYPDIKNNKWYCYILRNKMECHKNRTYNGFTNNPKNRLRQHNQEIKGGAKYTSRYGNKTWEIYALLTGFPDSKNALQCEWRIKHPNNKRKRPIKYNSPSGRIKGLNEVLKLNRWTNNSIIDNDSFQLTLWITDEYAHLITDLPNNIKINIVDQIDLNNC